MATAVARTNARAPTAPLTSPARGVTLLWGDNGVTSARGVAMKELRVRCKQCGDRFTVYRYERERTPAYCDVCREERKRDQARVRMARMRAHRR